MKITVVSVRDTERLKFGTLTAGYHRCHMEATSEGDRVSETSPPMKGF